MGARRNKTAEGAPLKVAVKCRKVSYPTHAEAFVARIRVDAHNRREKRNRGRIDIFYCTSCCGWHLGHHRPWEKRRKKK